MKVLVTGSEGYIGTVLLKALIEKGYDVIGLDTCFYSDAWFSKEPKQVYKLIRKDVRKVEESDLHGLDCIIHLAELSNDPLGEIDPEITEKINHLGTISLIKKAKSQKVKRFIYFSSCSAYGASDNMVDEKSKTNPQTTYAKCKLLNEKFLQTMASKDFCPVIMRNATVFGISPRMRFDLVVNNLCGVAWTTKEIKMQSNGEPWRPLIHVKDVCQVAIKLMEAPREKVFNQIINIGSSDSNYQIKDIASSINIAFPKAKVTFNKDGADKRNYRVNFEKFKKLFPDFFFASNLEYGISELNNAFKQTKITKSAFNSRNYTRLKQIKYLLETNKIDRDLYWRN